MRNIMFDGINESIEELFKMLSCESDETTQKKGIEEAKKIKKEYLFVLMQYKSKVAENCAKALYELSDEVLKSYSTQLLEWIQDMNWPGAWIILERLKKFNETKLLACAVERSVKTALVCDDQHWLKSMSELLDNKRLKEDLPKDILEILNNRYHWYND